MMDMKCIMSLIPKIVFVVFWPYTISRYIYLRFVTEISMDNWLVYNIFVHENLFEWVLKVMPLEWFGILKEYEIGNDYFCMWPKVSICKFGWD